MTGFTDIFGGQTLQPSEAALREIALTANIATVWPPYSTDGDYLAAIMQVNSTSGNGLSIALPEANLGSPGAGALFINRGANTFTVTNFSGGVVGTVAAGACKFVYIDDNSTQAGVWNVITLGAGTSNLDAGALAGMGLLAIAATLNAAAETEEVSADFTIDANDRAKSFVWTGGAGEVTLPLANFADKFYFELRNQGDGPVTLAPTAPQEVDGSAEVVLQLNESCFVHAGADFWYTVGRGRNTQFNFTQLVKAVTTGTYQLSLTEAANVLQTYTGAKVSNVTIELPGAVQIYYVRNLTTGAFNLRFQSPTPGAVVDVPNNENAILLCDGVNVYNAVTFASNVSTFPALNVNYRSSNTPFALADRGSMNEFTGSFTQTFDPAATLASGWYADIQNVGTGVITLDPSGTETFYTPTGARQTLKLYPGEGYRITCNGVGFSTVGRPSYVQLAPAQTVNALVGFVNQVEGYDDTELSRIEHTYTNATSSVLPLGFQVYKAGGYITTASYSVGITYVNGAAAASLTGQTFGYAEGDNTAGVVNGVLAVTRPTVNSATQMMTATASTSAVGAPKNNSSLIGVSQTTVAPIEGVRFGSSGGGAVTGTFVHHGYRG